MVGLMEEYEAQMGMMDRARRALATKNPNHDLLKLVDFDERTQGFTFTPDYERRCVRPTDRGNILGYARYTFALEAAVSGGEVRLLDTNPPCEY